MTVIEEKTVNIFFGDVTVINGDVSNDQTVSIEGKGNKVSLDANLTKICDKAPSVDPEPEPEPVAEKVSRWAEALTHIANLFVVLIKVVQMVVTFF